MVTSIDPPRTVRPLCERWTMMKPNGRTLNVRMSMNAVWGCTIAIRKRNVRIRTGRIIAIVDVDSSVTVERLVCERAMNNVLRMVCAPHHRTMCVVVISVGRARIVLRIVAAIIIQRARNVWRNVICVKIGLKVNIVNDVVPAVMVMQRLRSDVVRVSVTVTATKRWAFVTLRRANAIVRTIRRGCVVKCVTRISMEIQRTVVNVISSVRLVECCEPGATKESVRINRIAIIGAVQKRRNVYGLLVHMRPLVVVCCANP